MLILERLPELRQRATTLGVSIDRVDEETSKVTVGSQLRMAHFFGMVGTVQSQLSEIKRKVDSMENLRKNYLQCTTVSEEEAINSRVQVCVDETNKLLIITKSSIEMVDRTNEKFESIEKGKKDNEENSNEIKVRSNISQTLVRRLRDLLVSFQRAQGDFAADAKERAVRQMQVALPTASDEEVENLVNEGITASAAISQRMSLTAQSQQQGQVAHMEVMRKLYGLKDRVNDMKKLERSIAELHQVFVEMSALVDKQGEMMDHIEYNVGKTKENTKSAESALETARKRQLDAQKKMVWLCMCCGVLMVIIMIPMWISGALNPAR